MGATTMEEVQLLLEMPLEVKKGREKDSGFSLSPTSYLFPDPLIGQTHLGVWETESSGISFGVQSRAGEEDLDGMDPMEADQGLAQSTPFTMQYPFSPTPPPPPYLTTSYLKCLSPTLAFSFPPMRGLANPTSHHSLRSLGAFQSSPFSLDVACHGLVNSL